MKKSKQQVKEILVSNFQARDELGLLCMEFYSKFYNISRDFPLDAFFAMCDNKKLPSVRTVERCSRLLQMEFDDLRGAEWQKRQRQVIPVQKDLGYNTYGI